MPALPVHPKIRYQAFLKIQPSQTKLERMPKVIAAHSLSLLKEIEPPSPNFHTREPQKKRDPINEIDYLPIQTLLFNRKVPLPLERAQRLGTQTLISSLGFLQITPYYIRKHGKIGEQLL